jgi:hypothetical protein
MQSLPASDLRLGNINAFLGGAPGPRKLSELYGLAPGVPRAGPLKWSDVAGLKAGLYPFRKHTFTPCGATGSTGPTLAQCRAEYPPWADTYLDMDETSRPGIQRWVVPRTGAYRIEAAGAQGGGPFGGKGARLRGTFDLTAGERLEILVGQQGLDNGVVKGGGGGSFVATEASGAPLVVAGGGGGADSAADRRPDATVQTTSRGSQGTLGALPGRGLGRGGRGSRVVAFHYGNHDGTYGDGSRAAAARGGKIFADAVLENPRFTSNTVVAGDFGSVYGWDTNQGWAVSASSVENSSWQAWQAFTKVLGGSGNAWVSGSVFNATTGVGLAWLQFQFPSPVILKSYQLNASNSTAAWADRSPRDWEIQGSDDGITWHVIPGAGRTDFRDWVSPGTVFTFDVSSNVTSYKFHRLYVTRNNAENNTTTNREDIVIDEWKLDVVPTDSAEYGSVSVSTAGADQTEYAWTPPTWAESADVLVVAGGGGAGGPRTGGAGGAGGLVTLSSYSITSLQKTISVGNGGNAGASDTVGINGAGSSFDSFTALGGGGGGANNGGAGGLQGGSGGGRRHNSVGSGALGIQPGNTLLPAIGYGNNGGGQEGNNYGGGGGGAGEAGFSGTASIDPGKGGDGMDLSVVYGSQYGQGGWFAGGGGGGANVSSIGANGGQGGGGRGGDTGQSGSRGIQHTGGGGGSGGNSNTASGGRGGSGIVLIKIYGNAPGTGGGFFRDSLTRGFLAPRNALQGGTGGGFGGGGGSLETTGIVVCGGGGYSAGPSNSGAGSVAGGGGSFNAGRDQDNASGIQTGHGVVSIELLDGPQDGELRTPKILLGATRLREAYTGPIFTVARSSDGAEADVYLDGKGLVRKVQDTATRAKTFGPGALETWLAGAQAEVVTWYDQSGNEIDAAGYAVGTATRPLLAVDKAPYVHFPGVNATNGGYFDLGPTTWNVATNGGFAFVGLVNMKDTRSWERVFDFGKGQANDNIIFARFSTTTNVRFSIFQGTTQYPYDLNNMITNNTWQIFCGRFAKVGNNQWTFSVWVDGVRYDSALSVTLSDRDTPKSYIGKSNWADWYAYMDVKSLVFFDTGSVSDAEILEWTEKLRASVPILDRTTATTQSACRLACSLRHLRHGYPGPMVRLRKTQDDGADVEEDFHGSVDGTVLVAADGQALESWLAPLAENPAMTADSTATVTGTAWKDYASSGFVATASSIWVDSNTYSPFKAFNKTNIDLLDCWHSGNNTSDVEPFPHWLSIQYPTPVSIRSYSITSRNLGGSLHQGYPVDFQMQGSEDGIEWTDLDVQEGVSWSINETKTFAVTRNITASFDRFRLYVTKAANENGSQTYLAIGQWRLFTTRVASVRTWYDQSGQGNHATQATLSRQAIIKDLDVHFDGTDDYFDLPLNAQRPATFSILTECVFDSVEVGQALYGEFASGSDQSKNYLAVLSPERLFFDQFPPGGGAATTSTFMKSGIRYQIAGVQTATNARSIYADGNLKASSTETYSGDAPQTIRIGSRLQASGTTSYITGSMSTMLLLDSALQLPDMSRLNHRQRKGALDSLNLATRPVAAYSLRRLFGSHSGPMVRVRKQNVAMGGTVTEANGYRIHAFTTVGTSTFTLNADVVADILVVAGGGGGGHFGGGGGAGEVVYVTSSSLQSSIITVTVGSGGAGSSVGTVNGGNGQNSEFGSHIAKGGGGGGSRRQVSPFDGNAGNDGGCGGGGAHCDGNVTQRNYGGSSTKSPNGFGNAGGDGKYGTTSFNGVQYGAGGGGGAGATGQDWRQGIGGGNGGNGVQLNITGTNTYYGGGGGGCVWTSGEPGTGGLGGGGLGGANRSGYVQNGTNGTINTGGGGGGATTTTGAIGGAGGSGIVLVRYKIEADVTFDDQGNVESVDDGNRVLTGPGALDEWRGGAADLSVVTWYDQSGQDNHIYCNPSPTLEYDHANRSYVVNTSSATGVLRAMVTTTYNGGRVGSGGYTVCSSFKINNVTSSKMLFSMGPANNDCNGTSIHPLAVGSQSRFAGGSCGARGTWPNGTGVVPIANSFTTVVTTYEGNGGLEKVYVNGIFDKQNTMTSDTPVNSANRMCIGWVKNDGAGSTMDAKIREILFYDLVTFTSKDVETLHNLLNVRHDIVEEGLELWIDPLSSPARLNGPGIAFQGGAKIEETDAGRYIDINGASQQYISTLYNPNLDNNTLYTWELWFWDDAAGVTSGTNTSSSLIMNYGGTSTTPFAGMSVMHHGSVRISERNSSNTWQLAETDSSFTVTNGKWYHIVMVADSSNLKLYVDGTQMLTVARPGGVVTSGRPVDIGGRSPLERYQTCRLGPVRCYRNKALTQAEVLQNYNAEKDRLPTF